MLETVLSRVYYNNSVGDYLYAFAVILAGFLLIRLLTLITNKIFSLQETRLKNSAGSGSDRGSRFKSWSGMQFSRLQNMRIETQKRLLHEVVFPLIFMAFFAYGLFSLEFAPSDLVIVKKVFFAILFIIVLRAIINTIEISFLRFSRKESRLEKTKTLKPVIDISKLVIWLLGIVFLMGNLGFDITTALAGLGISGIAIAIAAQGILGDLFGYFVILFDKPFVIGDLITMGDTYGWVDKIGIKTTHLRTLQGEVLIIANSSLLGSHVHNYNNMQHRRVVLSIGVTYDTLQEHVKAIPDILRDIIDSTTIMDGVVCDRSHFIGFGDFSLNFEATYFVPAKEYALSLDVQQDVNLRILEEFANRGIEFAFPSQTIYMQNYGAKEHTL